MATKKKSLLEEIGLIHDKAKQMKEELKDMGLDDVIYEEEMAAISSKISSEIWAVVR